MESFIILEDLLNKFWVIKSIEYCWKKVAKMSGFFFVRVFFSAQGKIVNLALYECCVTLK